MDFVNHVNYKIYIMEKNKIKNTENNQQITSQLSQSGIYLRDDHCDWGSSGMNEFTNEYSEDK